MATGANVLTLLCPDIEWVIYGDNYEDINWFDAKPAITKKQFTDGFAQYDALQNQKEADKTAAKTALLDRLGITAEEAQLLLS